MSGIKGYKKDYGEYTKHFRAQNGKCFKVSVLYDECGFNPLEESDGNGKIHSFGRRHSNFLDLTKHGCWDGEDVVETLNDMFGPIFEGWWPLSYYEHGQCMWFPQGDYIPGVEYQWDGVRFAGVWEMDKTVQENLAHWPEEERRERTYKYCKGICSEYTDWCNGYIFYYAITVIDAQGNVEEEDSCGGYFGSDEDHLHDSIQEVLSYYGAEQLREIDEDEVFSVEQEEMLI